MSSTPRPKPAAWLRGLLSVPAGYVLWAGGLMALVTVLFLGTREAPIPIALAAGGLGAAALAFGVAKLTKLIAGPAGRTASLVVAMLVLAVGALNVGLGVAVEPPWFTVLTVTIGAGGIGWLGRK